MVHSRIVESEPVWSLHSDGDWRQRDFRYADEGALLLLIDALNQLMKASGGDWASIFPHMLAIATEDVAGDEDRRQLLLRHTVACSAANQSVSAIHRLLRGEKRQFLAQDVAELREQLKRVLPLSSAWAAGQLRSLLLALDMP
jgi:hypothetical protein